MDKPTPTFSASRHHRIQHSRRARGSALLFGLLCCGLLPSGALAQGESALEQLGWLSGCWQAEDAEPGSGEFWTSLAGGTLLGIARTVHRGQTVSYEFMQIRRDADGQVVLGAQPSGREETRFQLQALSAGQAVFENPAHDFPQRVIYKRLGGQHMQARIEGLIAGAFQDIVFSFRRQVCAD